MKERIKLRQLLQYFDKDGDDPIIQIVGEDWEKYATARASHPILHYIYDMEIIELAIITGLEADGDSYAIRIRI